MIGDPRGRMPRRRAAVGFGLLGVALLGGCAAEPAPQPAATRPDAPSASASVPAEIVGTRIRFSSDRTTIDVTIGEDSPAVRDLLSLLPAELSFEDLNSREKIASLPRELAWQGSPGSDPEDGDLIYYSPWGNLGLYYDASGIEYSDDTLHIGTYDATEEQLALLVGGPVTLEIID